MAATDFESIPKIDTDAAGSGRNLVVMKFGGSSVADTGKITEVARRLVRAREEGQRVAANGVQEVVLATNPNMTGEATAAYLADRLRGRVRVTRLASGLPVGGDLEYADEVTLGRALTGRREMT